METGKTCSKCGAEKPLSEFHFRRERGKHYAKCKACWNEKHKAWILINKEKHRASHSKWVAADPERARAAARKAATKKRSDPSKRLAQCISTALYISLQGIRKRAPTFRMLGYTREDLMAHLERQFQRGMSWANYGKWHVDHIRPLKLFQFKDKDDPAIMEAWGLSNLRPLWAKDNMSKKDRRTHLV